MATDVRVLLAPEGADTDDLASLYAAPEREWFRANMVSTLDGGAAGSDGRSGSINNEVDREVFALLRDLADVIVVGAGTARAEGYRPATRPIVVVSRSGTVPELLRGAASGDVLLATCAAAPQLTQARALLGDEAVWVLGEESVDLGQLRARLTERGWRQILCEGGPGLLRDLMAAGVVDELCLTWVPELQAGSTTNLLTGEQIAVKLELQMLLECNSTLMGRWRVRPPEPI